MTTFLDAARSVSGLAALPGFEEYAAQRRAFEERALKRKMTRAMLGGCECGEVVGDALCPWCDRDDLPEHLRDAAVALRRRDLARGKIDVAAVVAALSAKQEARDAETKAALRAMAAPPVGARNRFERRRNASRKWKR